MIIGLSGHIKSGKSTAATFIKENFPFVEKYFAYKLKLIASILTGDDIKLFETQEGKEGMLEDWGMTRRKMLQQLGTESLRNHFHDEVWIKSLFADYKPTYDGETLARAAGFSLRTEELYPNWIVSDVRFSNEADAIKKMGGLLIRINRPFSLIYPEIWAEYLKSKEYIAIHLGDSTYSRPSEGDFVTWLTIGERANLDLHHKLIHPSETGLDGYNEFDLVIDNTGSVVDLQQQLSEFLTSQLVS